MDYLIEQNKGFKMKLASLFLMVMMSLGLVACSGDDNSGANNAAAPAAQSSGGYNPDKDQDGDC